MAGAICDNCGSVVGAEQFCPQCGAWVDPMQASGTSEEGFEEFDLSGAPPPEEPAPSQPARLPRQEIQCPSCGSPNPTTNRHCEECGARLSQAALPVAPRPAVQATAGVRAAMAFSGLLVGVVLLVILFNAFGGDSTAPTTSEAATPTTSEAQAPAQPITILAVNCSIAGYSGFDCDNLRTGNGEYQFSWEGLGADQEVTIELVFDQPYDVTQLVWMNLDDGDRFYQNYRAQNITVTDEQVGTLVFPDQLENKPGTQVRPYVAVGATKLLITITKAYPSEERAGNVYGDIAIKGIQVMGRPARIVSPTTTPSTTGG